VGVRVPSSAQSLLKIQRVSSLQTLIVHFLFLRGLKRDKNKFRGYFYLRHCKAQRQKKNVKSTIELSPCYGGKRYSLPAGSTSKVPLGVVN
jgi:hypothetical protein